MFESGKHKTGGRQKGTENKLTKEAKELFLKTLTGQVEYLEDAFNKVRERSPSRYLELFAKYIPFFIPKQVEINEIKEPVKQIFKIGEQTIEI